MSAQATLESGNICRTTIAKSPGARFTPAVTRPPHIQRWVTTIVTLPLPAEMRTRGRGSPPVRFGCIERASCSDVDGSNTGAGSRQDIRLTERNRTVSNTLFMLPPSSEIVDLVHLTP